MNASFYLPTRILAGRGALVRHPEFLQIGRSAFIVTGKKSARLCGALDDVTALLSAAGISYTVFDQISENPPVLTCYEGGRLAAEAHADFVIGIGGGSPLDAAKAIAAFAANQGIEPMDIYDAQKRTRRSLPIIAIPTTAGTGSEVNAYSVLTLPNGDKKKTFTSANSWPRAAFVDPKYTDSLPYDTTISTALDAFAHAAEGFFTAKCEGIERLYAEKCIPSLYSCLKALAEGREITEDLRDELYYGSIYAGLVINTCGTAFPHPMGYVLTENFGVPHGTACAVFQKEFYEYNKAVAPELAAQYLDRIGCSEAEYFQLLQSITPPCDVALDEARIAESHNRWIGNVSIAKCQGEFTADMADDILRRKFCVK